jgi:adenine-specific DNA-methyltransferase
MYKNPDNDPRGPWIPIPIHANHKYDANYKIVKPNGIVLERPKNNYWRLSEKKFNEYVKDNRIWWGEGSSYPMIKKFLSEVQQGLVPKSIFYYDEVGGNPHGDAELKKLFEGKKIFENPKCIKLIKTFLQISTSPSDLILDFFAGSGTTAHAVMELNKEDGGNRKFILVQLPEPTAPDSEAFKAGYKTIADIAKERIRRAAKKIQGELDEEKKKKGEELPLEPTQQKKLDLGFKVFKLDESNFKQWRPFVPESEEEIKQAVLDFTENIKFEATVENILYELILKNGKKLTDEIEKKNGYYVVNNNELVLLLESVEKSVIDEVLLLKPQKVVALDKLFNGNDQLKTNTVLQFRDEGIEFKSV